MTTLTSNSITGEKVLNDSIIDVLESGNVEINADNVDAVTVGALSVGVKSTVDSTPYEITNSTAGGGTFDLPTVQANLTTLDNKTASVSEIPDTLNTFETVNDIVVLKNTPNLTLKGSNSSITGRDDLGALKWTVTDTPGYTTIANDGRVLGFYAGATESKGIKLDPVLNEIKSYNLDLNMVNRNVKNYNVNDSNVLHNEMTLGETVEVDAVSKNLVSVPKQSAYNKQFGTGVGQVYDAGDVSAFIQQKGASNGLCPLGADSKIPSTYIPSIAITSVTVVADIPARDLLVVETGDVAKVIDAGSGTPETYIYDGSIWILIEESDTAFNSTDDLVEGVVNLYYTNGRVSANVDVSANSAYRAVGHLPLSGGTLSGSINMGSNLINGVSSVFSNVSTFIIENSSATGTVVLQADSEGGTNTITIDPVTDQVIITNANLNMGANDIITTGRVDNVYVGLLGTSYGDHITNQVNSHATIDTHLADLSKHRIINDAGTSLTELYSASKISTDITTVTNNANNRVLKAGDTMSGDLTLLSTVPTVFIESNTTNTSRIHMQDSAGLIGAIECNTNAMVLSSEKVAGYVEISTAQGGGLIVTGPLATFNSNLDMGVNAIITSGLVDGRNVSVDGGVLDGHVADLTKHRIINDAGTSLTELYSASKISTDITTVTNNANSRVLKAGDSMSGDLSIQKILPILELKSTVSGKNNVASRLQMVDSGTDGITATLAQATGDLFLYNYGSNDINIRSDVSIKNLGIDIVSATDELLLQNLDLNVQNRNINKVANLSVKRDDIPAVISSPIPNMNGYAGVNPSTQGNYVATVSLSTGPASGTLFDGNLATTLYSPGYVNGIPDGNTQTTVNFPAPSVINGSWWQLQNTATVQTFSGLNYYADGIRHPVDLMITGSNDGSTWDHLNTWTDLAFTGANKYYLDIGLEYSYSYIRLIITRIGLGETNVGAREIEFTKFDNSTNSTVSIRGVTDMTVDPGTPALIINGDVHVNNIVQDTLNDVFFVGQDDIATKTIVLTGGVPRPLTPVWAPGLAVTSQGSSVGWSQIGTGFAYTISQSGWYKIDANLNYEPNVDNAISNFCLYLNDIQTLFCSTNHKMNGRISGSSINAILNVVAGDTVKLYVESDINVTLLFNKASINAFRLRTNA